MTRSPHAWWHGLSGADKFRVYTRVTLQAAAVVVAVALALPAPSPWALPGIVVAATVAVFVLVAAVYAVAARTAGSDDVLDSARLIAILVVLAAALVVLPFVRGRWWWLLAAAVVTGAVFGEGWGGRALLAVSLGVFGAFAVGSTLLTMGALRLVVDLERARGLETRLRVADERLRFARDLHDVVGRGFSAIAVKSELATTLVRAGAHDRAATEMDEVRSLAVESMEQMRHLVRGYRGIDLAGEVAGARSLLEAVGCRLVVEGDPTRLPAEFVEVAAWVTREGTTNIVKHAAATSATLALGPAGMTLRNDGARTPEGDPSGLLGLAERVEAVGASLHTAHNADEFVLEVRWPTT